MQSEILSEASRPKVLLVEDEPIVQMVHRSMLEKIGCQVVLAETGQEALAKQDSAYDLIFMDLGLPDIRGSEVTKQIRKSEKDKHTPIVVLTAYSQEEIGKECSVAGVDAIYNKPLGLETLQEILKRYVLISKG